MCAKKTSLFEYSFDVLYIFFPLLNRQTFNRINTKRTEPERKKKKRKMRTTKSHFENIGRELILEQNNTGKKKKKCDDDREMNVSIIVITF